MRLNVVLRLAFTERMSTSCVRDVSLSFDKQFCRMLLAEHDDLIHS